MRKRSLTISVLAVFASLSSAFAGTMVWDVTGNNLFGTLDLANGNFHQVSNLGFTPAGLGEIGGTLYTALSGGTSLYKINSATGAATAVGNAGISYYVFGSTNAGLFMVDTAGGLWAVNPATGSSSLVGSTHLNLTGVQSIALSAGSNNLYLALNNDLYTINTTSGSAAYLGTSGSTDFGAIVDVSGTVYASSIVAPNSVYLFNPATGTSSFVTLSNAPDYSWGLAPIVPEPGSFALLGLGCLLGGWKLSRKRKRN